MGFSVRELRKIIPGAVAGMVIILTVSALLFITFEENHPPTARIGISPGIVRANEPVTLDASGSSDPDDDFDELSFRWTIMDTFESTIPVLKFSFPEPGNYTVVLTVQDSSGVSDTDSIFVEVLP